MKITIATDFSSTPAGRYKEDGEFSGQCFREGFLIPNLENANKDNPLIVNLNDAEGYGSSFLEEAFGGLVREEGYDKNTLRDILKIESNSIYSMYKTSIWEYIDSARAVDSAT